MDDALIRELRRRGTASAAELQQALGISQPTFSRLTAKLTGQVVAMGRARATRYALLRDLRGLGSAFPLYQVDAAGQLTEIGALRCLEGGRWHGHDPIAGQDSFFEGLPYFLSDLRPQGFMGRAFPLQHADLHLPERIADWNDDDTMVALIRRGDDMIGKLIVGTESMQAYLAALSRPPPTLAAAERATAYPRLAEAALHGDPAGSSAGGEQPKFAASFRAGTAIRHVLVKFSPLDDSPVSQRWRDLLVAEHLAAIALANMPDGAVGVADTRLIAAGGRWFLEVTRFDRIDERGRCGVISLGAMDDEHYGRRDNWVLAADRLQRDSRLQAADAEALRIAHAFGGLIGNTDRHFGNVSLCVGTQGALGLAPAYDQLPMLYAPMSGQLVERQFAVELPQPQALVAWKRALPLAEAFWNDVANDARISGPFRQIAAANRDLLVQRARPFAAAING